MRLVTFIVFFVTTLVTSAYADGLIKKQVYSFKDVNGNIVFTDKKPAEKTPFKTQTIEATKATPNASINSHTQPQQNYSGNSTNNEQVVRVIVEERKASKKKIVNRKHTKNRCQSYKKKFDYYSDKMRAGYKNSEYKKLESNRKKYRNLLFKQCETRTFAD